MKDVTLHPIYNKIYIITYDATGISYKAIMVEHDNDQTPFHQKELIVLPRSGWGVLLDVAKRNFSVVDTHHPGSYPKDYLDIWNTKFNSISNIYSFIPPFIRNEKTDVSMSNNKIHD